MAYWDVAIEMKDKVGGLAEVGEAFGAAKVNLEGIWTHMRDGQAHVHCLVGDKDAAEKVASSKGWNVHKAHEVLVIPCEDRPGWLGEQGRKLANAGLNIEWCYTAMGNRVVIACKDLAKAREVLGKVGASA